jgi:hypothetical protein
LLQADGRLSISEEFRGQMLPITMTVLAGADLVAAATLFKEIKLVSGNLSASRREVNDIEVQRCHQDLRRKTWLEASEQTSRRSWQNPFDAGLKKSAPRR